MITLKRAYDPPADRDGDRILVDRMWPRGKTKEELRIAGWMKDLAPSAELRRWFGHDPSRWEEFRRRYERELSSPDKRPLLTELEKRSRRGHVTFVFAAHDELYNNAVVLREYLERPKG